MSENGFIINSSISVSNPTETPLIIVIKEPSATVTVTIPTLPYDNKTTPIETSTQTTATPTIENSPFITSTTSYSPSTIPTIPSQIEQLSYPSSPSDNGNDIATEQKDVNLASVLVPIFTITFITIIIGIILYRKRLRNKSRQHLIDTNNSDKTLYSNETIVIDGPDYRGDGPFETIYNLSRPRRPPSALLGHRRTSTVLQFEAMHPHVVVVDMENNASKHGDSIIIGTDGRDGDCRMIKVLQLDDASEPEDKNRRRGCFIFGKK